MGRSALLHWTAVLAEDAGARVLRAQGSLQEAGSPYAVVQQLLNPVGHLDVLRWEGARAGLPPDAALLPGLCRKVLGLARRCPLLVLVDDLQWADPWSRRMLHGLMRRMHQAPVLVVVAVRSGTRVASDPGIEEAVELKGLDTAAIRHLLARAYDGDLDDAFVDTAARVTHGSPRLLSAVVTGLERDGLTPSAGRLEELRSRVAEAVDEQTRDLLDAMPEEQASLLRAIAVCGGELPTELVCSLARLTSTSPSEAVGLLRRARLVADGEPLVLTDPSAAACILSDLTPGAREQLYAAAAGLGHRAAAAKESVARLLLGTGRTGRPWAARTLREAAAHRRDTGDDGAAGRFLCRALDEELDHVERAHVLLDLAVVEMSRSAEAGERRLLKVIRAPGGRAVLPLRRVAADLLVAADTRGEAVAPRFVDRSVPQCGVGEGAMSSPLLTSLADRRIHAALTAWRMMLQAEDTRRSHPLARRALGGSWDDGCLFMTRIMAAQVLTMGGDTEESLPVLGALLAEADGLGLDVMAGMVLEARAWTYLHRGLPDEAGDDLVALCRRLPPARRHPSVALRITALQVLMHVYDGEFARARQAAESASPDTVRDGVGRPLKLFARGCARLAEGDALAAVGDLEECGRWLLYKGITNAGFLWWRYFASVARHVLGDVEEAGRLADEHQRQSPAWDARTAAGVVSLGLALTRGRGGGRTGPGRPLLAPGDPSPGTRSARELTEWTAARLSSGPPPRVPGRCAPAQGRTASSPVGRREDTAHADRP
ncbi:hypothetical protein ADK65_18510 [Streptomyces sp. NRRL B-1140]|nr:hypothetical protein ADK65_18510 [Streptomyces sp. NRRL B-1140]